VNPHPFTVDIPQTTLDELRERLARTHWPRELDGPDWHDGASPAFLWTLVGWWPGRVEVAGPRGGQQRRSRRRLRRSYPSLPCYGFRDPLPGPWGSARTSGLLTEVSAIPALPPRRPWAHVTNRLAFGADAAWPARVKRIGQKHARRMGIGAAHFRTWRSFPPLSFGAGFAGAPVVTVATAGRTLGNLVALGHPDCLPAIVAVKGPGLLGPLTCMYCHRALP
jgi:epoxide hydrolase-like protein